MISLTISVTLFSLLDEVSNSNTFPLAKKGNRQSTTTVNVGVCVFAKLIALTVVVFSVFSGLLGDGVTETFHEVSLSVWLNRTSRFLPKSAHCFPIFRYTIYDRVVEVGSSRRLKTAPSWRSFCSGSSLGVSLQPR